MFENRKDTILLQGALLSAASTNSGSLFGCDELENALSTVFNSLKKIINQDLYSIREEKENIKTQLHINKRLHAAVFYTTLRSHGFTCNAADSFYSSIADLWPEIDLKFYVELNFKCEWSEYFIKCASQLPSEILHKLLKIILDIPFSKQVESYTWHLILQTLIHKLLEVPHESEIEASFHFDFSEDNSKVVENESRESTEKGEVNADDLQIKKLQDELLLLKDIYNNMYNCICAEINKSTDNVIKILLHAVKTLLKIFLTERERSYKNISVDFLKIFDILNNNLKSDACQEMLKAGMRNSSDSAVKHTYATTSWNISESYLCFLLSCYRDKVLSDFCFKTEVSTSISLVYSEIKANDFLYETLNALNPLFASSEIDNDHLNFLHKILELGFEGASFAAKMLLSKPALLERNNTIKVLEQNSHTIDFMNMYPFILRSVKAIKSQDWKFRLLKLFYKLIPVDNFSVYNDVLQTILNEHGLTEEFQLPDFSEQLSECFRIMQTIKEAEGTFPMLFIQNPLTLLKKVIDETLIQGPEGRAYIEPLKHVQYACTYQESKDALPILIGILNDYFERSKLLPWEKNNMVTLYKFLMKLQSEERHIMVLDVFFRRCIIPKLQYDFHNIGLILECLCVILTILIQNNSLFIGHDVLMSFIISLGKVINDCIETQNGKLKASVLSVIQALETHQLASGDIKDEDKMELWSSFQRFSEVVYIYMKQFLPEDTAFSSKPFVWTSCCKNKDSTNFEEQFSTKTVSHLVLLQTLIEVLPHFTIEEWLYSVNLVRECLKNDVLRAEILQSLKKPFDLSDNELDTYVVVSCLLTSLHCILQECKEESGYIIGCFTKTLMGVLNEEVEENTNLLMTVLFDCCYLGECISPADSNLVTMVLLDLKKYVIESCTEEGYKNDCKKLMSCAVKCLPNFYDKPKMLI